ncbi:MAG TPA: hypothetical protein VK149_05245 [Sideroxyarcus sp.]|nr:hypothetical protein [Sideroxyarcus sp.]
MGADYTRINGRCRTPAAMAHNARPGIPIDDTMQRILFILLLTCSALATAAEIVRCGTDPFGNLVCLDKDGVITSPPKQGKEGGASGVPATETMDWQRCGIDPFGNKVCRP